MPHRVLVVEDDPVVRRSIGEALADEGLEVEATSTATEALAAVARAIPDLVLSDIRLPGMDGLELLRLLRARAPDVVVVMMTAYDDMPTVARAMRDGAVDFLVKPIRLQQLRDLVARLLADRTDRVARPPDPTAGAAALRGFVGKDPRMLAVYKRIGQISASRITILIRGDTGTGKGMVARAIHDASPDASEPFIAVNCTAVPETLLESELFGHVRGAFTGAVADRRGRFALAGRGTIFLDEIGDTSPEFQAKLLRVLEDREFYPVGAERPARSEARVIAATHRDLERLVQEHRFREDLYYRLRVVELVLPTLHERLDDIPLLARHFVALAAREQHRAEPSISDEAMARLVAHLWPGNVRELENCLSRAVALASAGVIRAEHLELRSTPPATDGSSTAREGAQVAFPTIEAAERDLVARALVVASGNRTRAAELLGVSKPRLYRLLRKHGLG